MADVPTQERPGSKLPDVKILTAARQLKAGDPILVKTRAEGERTLVVRIAKAKDSKPPGGTTP